MDNRPIGIFDSGLGGLNGLRALRRFLPDENVVYFADSGRLSQIEGKGVGRLGAALFQNGKLQAGPQRLQTAQLRQVGRGPKDPLAPEDGKPRGEIDVQCAQKFPNLGRKSITLTAARRRTQREPLLPCLPSAQDGGKVSLAAQEMGPEAEGTGKLGLSVRDPIGSARREPGIVRLLHGKIGMPAEESGYGSLVFLRREGTGGIDQPTARAEHDRRGV